MTIEPRPLPKRSRDTNGQPKEPRPQSDNQQKACRRNFALFVLRGMQSHLCHVTMLPPDHFAALDKAILQSIGEIERSNKHGAAQE